MVALLQTAFIPCHISARNTPECMHDPRDVDLLGHYARTTGEQFQGGEREAFVLPDGTMQQVFLSLHGPDRWNGQLHMTAAGRRSELAVQPFRQHAERALRAAGGLPEAWDAIWRGEHELVRQIAATAPRWPEPEPGALALRVFVRNSYRMYDDMHGCELVPLAETVVADWCRELAAVGDRAALPDAAFRDLARAMVPRGQVDTTLADGSIAGRLELAVQAVDGDLVRGRVTGHFALLPQDKAEVGRRPNAACRFTSEGRLVGRFVLDRAAGQVRELRVGATGVALDWRSGGASVREFDPFHAIGIELVAGPER